MAVRDRVSFYFMKARHSKVAQGIIAATLVLTMHLEPADLALAFVGAVSYLLVKYGCDAFNARRNPPMADAESGSVAAALIASQQASQQQQQHQQQQQLQDERRQVEGPVAADVLLSSVAPEPIGERPEAAAMPPPVVSEAQASGQC